MGRLSNWNRPCFILDLTLTGELFQRQIEMRMTRLARATPLHHQNHQRVVYANMLVKAGRTVHQITQVSPHQNEVANLERLTAWSEMAITLINLPHKA